MLAYCILFEDCVQKLAGVLGLGWGLGKRVGDM